MMADEQVFTYGETSFFNACQSDLEKCESLFSKYFKVNNYEYESGKSGKVRKAHKVFTLPRG